MTISKFDRPACRIIEQEAIAALQAVAALHGLTLKAKSGNFSPEAFNVTLTFSTTGAEGIPQDFARAAPAIGLKAEDFGKTFTTLSGKTFRITGINLRRRKYPVSVVNVKTERGFKMSARQVIADLQYTA